MRSHLIAAIVIGNWLLYLATTTVLWSVHGLLSERPREDLRGYLFLPAYHVYRTYHRLVMIFAQLEELFFRKSLTDPFAPDKVQEVMPDW